MRLLTMLLSNFGSYTNLDHDFNNQGLSLIHGPTGVGKSTLFDGPMWILFGETAKNGGVDDIRSWNNENITRGWLMIQTPTSIVTVHRVRGGPSKNDLYWTETNEDQIYRGKDTIETQRLLNDRLGLNSYVYSLGSYYNEFSPAASFFTDKATNRRQLFESIADLSFPTTLGLKLTEERKALKEELEDFQSEIFNVAGKIQQLESTKRRSQEDYTKWEAEHAKTLAYLTKKVETFEETHKEKCAAVATLLAQYEDDRKEQLEGLETEHHTRVHEMLHRGACESCGHLSTAVTESCDKSRNDYATARQKILSRVNPYLSQVETLKKEENVYVQLVEEAKTTVNPHKLQLEDQTEEVLHLVESHRSIDAAIGQVKATISSVEHLIQLNILLRAELIKNTIKSVEHETNRLLETYFDSEVRVSFDIQNRDKLEILGQVSGHNCPYSQFSKGQRGLLKFAFGAAIMRAVSNNTGIKFETLFLDEPLDGCDSDLKVSAFNLFTELAKDRDGVLVIDHSESLQNMFDRKYLVEMSGGVSTIQECK